MPTEQGDVITIRSSLTVWGLGGPDEFRWYSGNATIYGGDTDEQYDSDVYGLKTGGDRLYVMRDTDIRVRFITTADGFVATAGQRLNFNGIERLHLGGGDDNVNASGASMERWPLSIYANGGNDKIIGSRGGDFVDPGAGNDLIRAGAGDDFIEASKGNDRVYGGPGDDNIRWGRGDPYEVVGDDRLYGGAGGWDLVNVWIKDEWLNSSGVEVTIKSVARDGSMTGSSFTDVGGARSTLKFQGFEQGWTHEGKDYVSGADANIRGGKGMQWSTRAGDDVLIGTNGNDTLEGGAGKDTITGGRGNDLIVANTDWWRADAPGDGDTDLLVFRRGDGDDTVCAFDVQVDRLDVGGRRYEISVVGGGTLVEFAGGDSILIRNVWNTDLHIL